MSSDIKCNFLVQHISKGNWEKMPFIQLIADSSGETKPPKQVTLLAVLNKAQVCTCKALLFRK